MTVNAVWPDTHIFREYLKLKEEVPSAILFMEMGLFLEVWGADAVCAAPLLGVALSHRGSFLNGEPIPICAVPADNRFTSANEGDVQFVGSSISYLKTVVGAGYPVAIAFCEATTPVTRKIELTIWPDETWTEDALENWIS